MRTIVVFASLAVVLACPALATNWPLVPLDSVHPLGNNWGNYQHYDTVSTSAYFHNGIDVITPGAQGRRVSAVRHGWVKAWGTIQAEYHYRLAICDTNSSFTGRAEGWLYAHIDSTRWHRNLGDEVQAGDSIGYLVPWPVTGFDHCHFARISDTGATWQRFPNPTWSFIQNPLTIIRPNTDTVAPVIENARTSQKFAFCRDNRNNSYVSPDSLVGKVDIIAKAYDKTGTTTGNATWDKLAPYEIDYSIKREDGLVVVPWRIGVQFSNTLDGSLVNVVYKADNTCKSQGDYDYRAYYFIVTNTDGDSIIDAADTSGNWDTGLVGDTTYWVYVRASDITGNTKIDSMQVRTRNGLAVEAPPYAVLSRPLRAALTVGRGGLISFGTAGSGAATLRVYDQTGRVVTNLADGRLGPGEHRFTFAPPVAGVYFVKLTLDGRDTYNTKLVVLR
ncbi:MAG TPA: T9SS type A sorting domain-containing protein [bacterium]|nr:T9SS type A sorting domain-containing protein [bacterium]